MNAKGHLTTALILGSVFCAPAVATIIGIAPPDSPPGGGLSNPYWIFDYELQHMTIVGDVYLRSSAEPDDPHSGGEPGGGTKRQSGQTANLQLQSYSSVAIDGSPWGEPLYDCVGDNIRGFAGEADSDSVLHVSGIFKNKTGLPWKGWRIEWGADYIWGNKKLEDVVYISSSKFGVVADSAHRIILSGEQLVLPEEAFTFAVDVYVGEGLFYDDLAMAPMVPEPTTALLLALGGIGLRSLGAQRCAIRSRRRDRRAP